MILTRDEVLHIAALARLELSEDEVQRYQRQLSDILAYAARLQALDTSQVAPTASVLTAPSALRPDEPAPSLPVETLLDGAPQAEDGQFRVPPVLDAP